MGQTADAILCELLAWNNCLVSAAGIFQPAVGGRPSGLNGMVANYVPGPLGTQYGALIFAHSSQVLVAWMLMFTKGQDVSWTLASNSLFF